MNSKHSDRWQVSAVPAAYEVGDVVEVSPQAGGAGLPDGLPAGAQVRVIGLRPGRCAVERDGREWEVAAACVVPRRAIRHRPVVPSRPCPSAERRGGLAAEALLRRLSAAGRG